MSATLNVIVEWQEWANRYRIKPREKFCPQCEKKFLTTIPIAFAGYRGLMIPEHGCGPNMPFTCKPVSDEEIGFWREIGDAVKVMGKAGDELFYASEPQEPRG